MPLLTEQEIEDLYYTELDRRELSFARAVEAAVIEKIKAQGPTAYWDGCYSNPYFRADYNAPGIGKGGIPLYRLPEGD